MGRVCSQNGEMVCKFEQINLQEIDLWGGLDVDGKTILEWTLKR